MKNISEGGKGVKIHGGQNNLLSAKNKKIVLVEEENSLDDKIMSYFSPIDESCVDYIGEDGNLELYFD